MFWNAHKSASTLCLNPLNVPTYFSSFTLFLFLSLSLLHTHTHTHTHTTAYTSCVSLWCVYFCTFELSRELGACCSCLGFPCGSDGKKSTCNAGDPLSTFTILWGKKKKFESTSFLSRLYLFIKFNFPLTLRGEERNFWPVPVMKQASS